MNIADSTVSDFQNDGVVVLRGVFRDWVEPLSQGVSEVMAHPSPLERSYQPKDGSAPFFQDLCNWQRIPAFRTFIFELPAAQVAARLMGSPTSRFFHDHILVKRPGNSTITPWHQDQPYYCVEGDRTVSFWMPLDPVSRNVSLECVAGSHWWNTAGYRPKRFDGSPLYADEQFEEVPDIDAQRDHLVIRAGIWHRETPSHSTFAPFMVHRRTHRPSLDGSFHPAGSVPMRASCCAVQPDRRLFLI